MKSFKELVNIQAIPENDIRTAENFEYFRSSEDGYVYVHNTGNNFYTRYNAEGQNGKRISDKEYFEKRAEMVARVEAASYHTEEAELTEDQVAAIEATEESNATEEAEQVVEEIAPKQKRTRKSKDAAFTHGELTLTAKQVDFIHHLPDTDFYEHGLDSGLWVDVLCDQIGGQFACKPMTVGAMVSTLREKGLLAVGLDHVNGRKCKFIVFTELGKVVAAELGLH